MLKLILKGLAGVISPDSLAKMLDTIVGYHREKGLVQSGYDKAKIEDYDNLSWFLERGGDARRDLDKGDLEGKYDRRMQK